MICSYTRSGLLREPVREKGIFYEKIYEETGDPAVYGDVVWAGGV